MKEWVVGCQGAVRYPMSEGGWVRDQRWDWVALALKVEGGCL